MEKIDYKHGKFLILTTSIDGFKYEDYLEFCEDNGIVPPARKDSDEYLHWVYGERDLNYESDMDNIRSCKQYKVKVLITGKLGLWDGTHEICPVVANNVADAIDKCVSNCEDCNVWYNDGAIEVEAYHHDGTNCFTIRPLSAKGQDRYERAVNNFRIGEIELTNKDTKRLPYLYAI